MSRQPPISSDEKQLRVGLIAAWFLANENKWATKEVIVDSIDELIWDTATQRIFHAKESNGLFEIRYEKVVNKIFKTPRREFRLKPEEYERLRNADVATATADDSK